MGLPTNFCPGPNKPHAGFAPTQRSGSLAWEVSGGASGCLHVQVLDEGPPRARGGAFWRHSNVSDGAAWQRLNLSGLSFIPRWQAFVSSRRRADYLRGPYRIGRCDESPWGEGDTHRLAAARPRDRPRTNNHALLLLYDRILITILAGLGSWRFPVNLISSERSGSTSLHPILEEPQVAVPVYASALAWYCPVGPSPGNCQPLMLPSSPDGMLGRAAGGTVLILFKLSLGARLTPWHTLRVLSHLLQLSDVCPRFRCALSQC